MSSLQTQRQQSVLNLLHGLKGQEPLKKLFWTELNYDRVNNALPRRGWGEQASSALVDDPVLLATGDKDFHVIHAQLKSEKLLMGMERPVVSRLLQDHPYALFVFSNANEDQWHFLNVKYDDDVQKRRVFRRITVGAQERLRTASERISMLDLGSIVAEHAGLSPLEIQKRHDQAFDVEPVTQEFFRKFAEVYHRVAEDIASVHGLEKEAGRLSQLLLDRMLFLYFIQKKGWLNNEPDYLYKRFRIHHEKSPKSEGFHSDVLQPLFFRLSNPELEDDPTLGAIPFLNGGLFEESTQQSQTERIRQARMLVKNSTFKVVFDDLLEKFNFTVTEDTPLDVEVAIDPEMLGKIFESLILQLEEDPDSDLRRITGSYYTPRAIVHFMCQHALRNFLAAQLASSDALHRVSQLIEYLPAHHLDEAQYADLCKLLSIDEAKMLRQSIFDARICDPAVGSGAFPVGMLHEMVATTAKLDAILNGRSVLNTRNYDYALKQKIIDRCIYGVDIQEQAVRLCELRLWLSLVVDYELDKNGRLQDTIKEVPTLPNLSYRIVRGDSLLERLFGHVVQLDVLSRNAKTQKLIRSIQADKEAYFGEARTDAKRKLELTILSKQAELAEHLVEAKEQSLLQTNLTLFGENAKDRKLREQREEEEKTLAKLRARIHSAKEELEKLAKRQLQATPASSVDQVRRRFFQAGDCPTFLWQADFAEVFADKGGFDIIIGNPPYLFGGNIGISQEDKLAFRKLYRSGSGKVNLFTLFIEKGLSLLAQNRPLVYIVPNTLLRVTSYDSIRELVLINHTISMIVDLGAGMFDDVTMSTIVISIQSGKAALSHQIEVRTSLTETGRFTEQKNYLAPGFVLNTAASPTDLLLIRRIERDCIRLGTLCDELIFGVVISGNKDDLVSDTPRRGWKLFLEGRDIERYFIRPCEKYLHYVPDKIHRPRSPRIFEASEKLLIQRITGGDRPLAAAYDNEQHYNKESINNLLLKTDSEYSMKFILALLNSTLMSWYYRSSFTNGSTLTVNLSKEYLSQLPLPNLDMKNAIDREKHDELVELANQMLRYGKDSSEKRRRIDVLIDEAVYRLYKLSEKDVLAVQRG